MSRVTVLLSHLRSLGIRLTASDGKLRVNAARGLLTSEIRDSIAKERVALLDMLEATSSEPTPIPRDSPLPLSSFQQRLWVLHRLEPANLAYNMATAWLFPAVADVDLLVVAIRSVVARHEILRATFRDLGDGPKIHVLATQDVVVEKTILDTAGQAPAAAMAVIEAARDAAVQRPFDMASEAPVRWHIFALPGGQAVVLVAAHHIVLDRWSFEILHREVRAALSDAIETSSALTETAPAAGALQYADYAAWQARNAVPEEQLDWWAHRLGGAPALCSFPIDISGTAEAPAGAVVTMAWDAEFSSAIQEMVREAGVTLYMAMVAAFAVVLRAYSGLDDIVIGSPMGTRDRPEFETVLGPFVNLLALRLDLSDDPDFTVLLQRVRDAVLDAHAYRQVPFERLVERLKPVRSFDRAPIFQTQVVLHNTDGGEPIVSGGAIQDVTWFARDVAGRIEGALEYRTDLYRRDTIERLGEQLGFVLRDALARRTTPISQLRWLGAQEEQRITVSFNATALELSAEPFPQQFEKAVSRHPERCAVRCGSESLTYDQLNRRANQVARRLRHMGIGPGRLVGLSLDRSIDMLVALIGIQKSGGGYVPLDPGFPAERRRFMLDDSGLAALVLDALPADEVAVPVIIPSNCSDEEESNLEPAAEARDIAYLIYTSGSTGRPKGVTISHGALSNLLGAIQQLPGLQAPATLAAVTTISFDIAGLELYLPLLNGGTIILVPRETASDGFALAELLSASGASVMQATPATWRMLLAAGWAGHPDFLALCGGEALSRDLANAIQERVGALWNLYGPTETTIWSLASLIECGSGEITLGTPLANTTVYVLDKHGAPTPIGVPGEIWIGGSGLAAGYHGQPEMTAERFVPMHAVSGTRLFRTGDLGRWRSDGQLVYLGRMDRQTKVNGFRIEPGEIEIALRRHPDILQTAVLGRSAGAEGGRLVGYIVFTPGNALTSSEIRAYLRSCLPEYMIPSVFVVLNSFPQTPNGKLDVQGLPDPFRNTLRTHRRFDPPRPGLEEQVARIWQRFVQAEQVGADDNFFEIGGDSLLAVQVAGLIERETGFFIPPRDLFFRTLRQVAASLTHGKDVNLPG